MSRRLVLAQSGTVSSKLDVCPTQTLSKKEDVKHSAVDLNTKWTGINIAQCEKSETEHNVI